MKKQLEEAIKNCAELASKNNVKADEALKYTQAATNAANAIMTITMVMKEDK